MEVKAIGKATKAEAAMVADYVKQCFRELAKPGHEITDEQGKQVSYHDMIKALKELHVKNLGRRSNYWHGYRRITIDLRCYEYGGEQHSLEALQARAVSNGLPPSGIAVVNGLSLAHHKSLHRHEYKSYAKDPVIGSMDCASREIALLGLVAHEVAHFVQFTYGPSTRWMKATHKKSHGIGFQDVYRILRSNLVNPLNAQQLAADETLNGSDDMMVSTAMVADINRLHIESQADAKSAMQKAIECGNKLLKMKETCSHGEWGPMLKKHIDIPRSTVTRYLAAAKNHAAWLEQNAHGEQFEGTLVQLVELYQTSDDDGDTDTPAKPKPVGKKGNATVSQGMSLIVSLSRAHAKNPEGFDPAATAQHLRDKGGEIDTSQARDALLALLDALDLYEGREHVRPRLTVVNGSR